MKQSWATTYVHLRTEALQYDQIQTPHDSTIQKTMDREESQPTGLDVPARILDNGEVTTLLCHANIRQQIKPVGSVTAIGAQNKISQ